MVSSFSTINKAIITIKKIIVAELVILSLKIPQYLVSIVLLRLVRFVSGVNSLQRIIIRPYVLNPRSESVGDRGNTRNGLKAANVVHTLIPVLPDGLNIVCFSFVATVKYIDPISVVLMLFGSSREVRTDSCDVLSNNNKKQYLQYDCQARIFSESSYHSNACLKCHQITWTVGLIYRCRPCVTCIVVTTILHRATLG